MKLGYRVREVASIFFNSYLAKSMRLLRLSKNKKYDELYKLMLEDMQKSEKIFHASPVWKILNAEFRDIFTVHGIENFKEQYINRHFAAYSPDSERIYESLLWQYYQNIQKKDTFNLLRKMEEPKIGGKGDIVLISGKRFTFDLLQAIDEFYSIFETNLLSEKKNNIILELGGGYGRLANVFLNAFPKMNYVILDLPESLLVSQFYLSRLFPESISVYEKTRQIKRISRNLLSKKRLWFFGCFKFPDFEDNAVDVFVNIYGLQEMKKEQVKNYLRLASEKTSKGVYLKQHFEENNMLNNEKITEKDYILPKEWKTVYNRTSNTFVNCFEKAFRKREFK